MKNFSISRVVAALLVLLSIATMGLLFIFGGFCGFSGNGTQCNQNMTFLFLIPLVMFLVGVYILIIKRIKK